MLFSWQRVRENGDDFISATIFEHLTIIMKIFISYFIYLLLLTHIGSLKLLQQTTLLEERKSSNKYNMVMKSKHIMKEG